MKQITHKNSNIIIARTYLKYYSEKQKELKILSLNYSLCTDISIRRIMRKQKEKLCKTLLNASGIIKVSLKQDLDITYLEINKYPELIEIKKKQLFLKNSIL